MNPVLQALNAPTASQRLSNLCAMLPELSFPEAGSDVNNHIHTIYSFSPYSPTAAAYMARKSGLCTAGIVDHDSVSGAEEFLKAAKLVGIAATVGVECRVRFGGTPFLDRRINNPDQDGVAYVLMHSIPHDRIAEVNAFFAPLRAKREERNRAMVARINELYGANGIALDYDRDVRPLSQADEGGSVTERHISSALAAKIESLAGGDIPAFLREKMGRNVAEKYEKMLCDPENPFRHYDLIGWIKAELIAEFYIPATDECADVRDVLALSERVGAISAYAYLGDVGDSATGDKRAQAFEDSYLDELFVWLEKLGFRAVTYMPTRDTPAQLERLRKLIDRYGFFEISGEDINQPRQRFICEAMRRPGFESLTTAAWAMIAHERRRDGLFSDEAIRRWPDLKQRVEAFAEEGRRCAD